MISKESAFKGVFTANPVKQPVKIVSTQTNEQDADNSLKKREQFAISLRKKKKAEIIALKRKKTIECMSKQKFSSVQSSKSPSSEQVPEFVSTAFHVF